MNIYGIISVKELISSLCLKNKYNAGFTFIIDLFDNNGNFLSLDRIKELNFKTNFNVYNFKFSTEQYQKNIILKKNIQNIFCNNDIAIINHLFFECFKVKKKLLLNIEEWLLIRFNLSKTFDRNSIHFG